MTVETAPQAVNYVQEVKGARRFESESGKVYEKMPRRFQDVAPEDVARRIGGELRFSGHSSAVLVDPTEQGYLMLATSREGERHGILHLHGIGGFGEGRSLGGTAVLLGDDSVTYVFEGRYLEGPGERRIFEWVELTRTGVSHHVEKIDRMTEGEKGKVSADIWNASYDGSLRPPAPKQN